MWLKGSFQSWSKLETLARLFQRIGVWFLLPAKEREEESGPEITLGLHKERKHSLLMATGDCSPSLLSSNTLMSISVFEPPDAQKEKKNSPWASRRKWNAGNTVSKYSLGLTVSPFYCSGCNHSSGGVIISPCPGTRQAGCTAWKCRKMIFPHAIQNFTLLTRTKGTKRRAFSDILFHFWWMKVTFL